MNVDELVQQAGERLAARPVAVPSFERLEQAARRRRQVAVGVLTVAVLAVTTVGVWAIFDGDAGTIRSSESTTAPTTPAPTSPTPSTTPGTTADAASVPADPVVSTATTVSEPVTVEPGSYADIDPDSTVILPPAPIAGRVSPAAIWTGAEMVVWGGSVLLSPSGTAPLSDGAAFNPATGSWRVIAAAPIQGRSDPATVWTGTEMLVWGGSAGLQTVADGAAYDPATDTWRTLAPAPIPDVARPVVAWTGTEMLVVSGMRAVGGGLTPVDDAAAYDPATDTWRTIASPIGTITAPYPQSTWTGDSLLMVTSETTMVATDSTQPPQLRDVVRLVEYRPATDTWTTLSDTFNYTFVGVTGVGAAVALPYEADVDGVILDRHGDVAGSVAGRPSTLTPVPFGQPVWTGREVLFWGGNAEGVAVDPAAQTWRVFPAGNVANRVDAAVVWADGVMLGWGGFSSNRDGTNVASGDGIMYRPPEPASPPQTTAPTPRSNGPNDATAGVDALEQARIRWSDADVTSYRLTVAEHRNYWSAGCTWITVVTDAIVTETSIDPSSPTDSCAETEWTVERLHDTIADMAGSIDQYSSPEFGQHTLEVTYNELGVPEAIEFDLANGYDEEASTQVAFTPLP